MKIQIADRQFWCDAVARTSDPTGTQDIRKKFGVLVEQRFKVVRNAVRQAVVEQDILGLKPGSTSPLALAGSTGNRELGFQTWLDNLLRSSVVEGGSWARPLLALAYSRAVRRAQRLSHSVLVPTDMAETIDALTSLALIELQGIVEATSQQIMRAAISAWLHNSSPSETFAEMARAIATIGVTRARTMGETLVVKSFTTGTLDVFEAVGIKRVGLIPELRKAAARVRDAEPGERRNFGLSGGAGSRMSREHQPSPSTIGRITKKEKELEADLEEESGSEINVQTAGDELVCQQCQDIEDDNPYTIDEARSLIPAHPHCRCAFVPLDDEEGFFGKIGKWIGKLFGKEEE